MDVRAQTKQKKQRVGLQNQGHTWVTSWEWDPICNHAQADLRGWPSGIVRELGKIGPGALVANKPLTDSKTKFLLVIYPCRVNYVFKKLF